MSDKIITEIVLEGEKEAIASIQRVGKAADATFPDLQNVQLNFDFVEPQKGLKSLTDLGQRFALSMKNTGNIVTNVFAGISSAFRNAGSLGDGVFSELTRSLQTTSLVAKALGRNIGGMGLMAIEVGSQILKLVTVVSLLGSAAIAAFGALAKSAANAINAVGEAARNARMSVSSYSALRTALMAFDISAEDADAAKNCVLMD
jgi:hypothetical protein